MSLLVNSTGAANFDPQRDFDLNQAQATQALTQIELILIEEILQAVFAELKQSSNVDEMQSAGGGGENAISSMSLGNGDCSGNGSAPLVLPLNAVHARPANIGAPQGSGQSASMLPKDTGGRANAIADDLRSRYGLTDMQIAGVLGNLQQESGLKPNVNQGGAEGAPSGNFADDNANGWGLAQWGGTRKQGEIAYAQQHHLDPGSLDANIGYMNQELDGPYSKTISDLKNTTSVAQATQVWDTDYEQATDPQMDNRLQYAQNFLNEGL